LYCEYTTFPLVYLNSKLILLKKEILITSDGSHTIYVPYLNETYHSRHGAIQESAHVFIKEGFNSYNHKNKTSILEVGFGTGLNAWLTFLEAKKLNKIVEFTSLEAYPLDWQFVSKLNYISLQSDSSKLSLFKKMHTSSWGYFCEISSFFRLKKLMVKLQDVIFNREFDLIYFDAFAPQVQPDLWTKNIFASMYKALKSGGMLVTYCAKGSVKRDMKSVGFRIESLQGPPGKREMTRAIKS